jgi:hypothetical protein
VDTERFWSIIEAGGREGQQDPERQLEAVRRALGELPPDELIEFHRLFNRAMDDAYTWDLWGAAYLINGGCSDDGFAYFRSWLISRGRAAYEAAVRDPASLAGLVDPGRDDYEFEDLWGVALTIYEERTGEEPPAAEGGGPAEPAGQRWDFDDDEAVSRRLPKLAALYLR